MAFPRRVSLIALLLACTGAACSTSGVRPDDAGVADAAPPCVPGEWARPSTVELACGGAPGIPAGASASNDGLAFDLPCPGGVLHLRVVDDGIIRLRHGDDPASRTPAVVAGLTRITKPPRSGQACGAFYLCTAELAVRIDPGACRLVAVDHAGTLIASDVSAADPALDGGIAPTRRLARETPTAEHIYGLGEKTGPLDRRGRAFTNWNTDAYDAALGGFRPDGDPLYQSIPFLIGLRGATAYGWFVDSSYRTRFDLAATDPRTLDVVTTGGVMDEYLIAGPAIPDVLTRYTALTGRPSLPPRWTLGFHQSRWGYAPETRVLDVAARLRSERIPADGIWIDIQKMRGFRSFTWDPATFPDPAAMIATLAARGFKTSVIVDPGIKVDPGWDVYDTGLAGGHFLVDAPGKPYVGEVWPGPAVFPDFSAAPTRAWWGSLVGRELGLGARGIWIDMNEPSNFVAGAGGTVPETLPTNGDGVPTTMAQGHNVYGMYEARAVDEGMRAAGPRRSFVLTRAGYAGVQRHAAVWTGDAVSGWPTLRGTLPMLLGMGLSGLPFVGSDVGGYSGGASPELYARWMELGSISPFLRAHVEKSAPDQEPWSFGTEVRDLSREAIERRYRLLPYLYNAFEEAARTGQPVLRPLVYAFQDDPMVADLADEAMLGPSLLVAPVLDEGAKQRSIYLPAGRWFELESGAIREGPTTFTADLTRAALPIYVREGAILPTAPPMQYSDEKPLSPLTLELYPGPRPSSLTLYEDDGDTRAHEQGAWTRVSHAIERSPNGARLTATPRSGSHVVGARSLLLRFHRVDQLPTGVKLDGAPLPPLADEAARASAPQGWWYDAADLALVVKLPDREAGFTVDATYDPAIPDPRPPVAVPLLVRVPAGTPRNTPIHVASSADSWVHHPLTWVANSEVATGTLLVPRGAWFEYKYTRGDWPTVEKWPGCVEATNRYAFGAAHPGKDDTVFAWADRCP